ncbi:hypothetical protein PAXINDRAFT_97084 [Paxillus involutus ATCC 200175]|nr:hypothetical protein PAXINDRAFT_97084 [Paxillus involutus ATCC 200175]
MLRSAGKNAALNGSKFIPPKVPLQAIHGRHGNALLLARHRLANQATCFRLVSTATTSASPKQTDSKIPPPNAPTRNNKKIELKPGPVKPTSLSLDSIPPQLPSQNASKKPHYHPPCHRHPPKPVETSLSAVALAKQDIASASEHGVLEPPPKDATSFKRFTHQAFQLLKFYFRGLKAINTHRKQVSAIRSRAKSGGALPSRAELRFIDIYTQDALKLLPFLVIVIIAEELIPFVALYAPRMLPSTCVLPGQRERIASKARNSQLTALFSHRGVFEAICRAGKQSGFVPLNNLGNPGAVCSLLGLASWGPSQLHAWRIRRHLNSISSDDAMLRKEGHGRHLTITELKEALLERGMIPVPERSLAEDLRAQLNWWLDTAEVSPEGSDPISRRLLMIGLIGSQK